MAEKNTMVSVIMGSHSDWKTMQKTTKLLSLLGISYRAQVVSAHRTPDWLFYFAQSVPKEGYQVIIAGAGGSAHLPGMVAAQTTVPVIGVPIKSKTLSGIDSLLSIVQMPSGVPVATMAIGESGAKNAAMLAASILSLHNESITQALLDYRQQQTKSIMDHKNLEENIQNDAAEKNK